MQYLGSKNKIAKQILPIMLAEKSSDQYWVEPFVGGADMLDKVPDGGIGNDVNEFLIELLIAVRDGYAPPENVTKEEYYMIKSNPTIFPKELVGFVGFLCSFGGKWWGGYAANSENRSYARVGSRALVKQSKNLKNCIFKCGSYLDLDIPKNSFVYCDPPYQDTCEYFYKFNHEIFWDWCRDMSKKGHTIFISEYAAPADFFCIKEVRYQTLLNKNSKVPRVEKLFRYKF